MLLGSQIIILIASIAVIIAAVCIACFCDFDGFEVVSAILFLLGILFVVISIFCPSYEDIFIKETGPAYTRPIVATNAESKTTAGGGRWSFVIGQKNVFRLYQVADDGGITLVEVPADKTTIYYTNDGEEPSVTYINCLFSEHKYFFWENREERQFEKVDRYILRVPADTISDFTFD